MRPRRKKIGWTRVLLMLLLLSFEANAFGRPRSHKHQNKSRNSVQMKNDCGNEVRASIENPSPDEATNSKTTDVDPYYDNCGLVGFGFVQKIPYQNLPHTGYSEVDVNLSSACMRCAICIAIAERVNQSLLDLHDTMYADQWLNETEVDIFLRAICDHDFRHYTLREIDGKRYIGDGNDVPGAKQVASNVDGNWESTLQKKCRDIVEEVGPQKLYKNWREWCTDQTTSKSLVEYLCRNSDSGGLRNCHNIGGHANGLSSLNANLCQQNLDWQARFKITAKLESG